MLSIEGVSKSYGRGPRAVDDLHLHVAPGEILGFLGPNGAGKTTTMKVVVGILKPDEGKVLVDGVDLHAAPMEAKRRMGYVPDEAVLLDKLTGLEYLGFMADVYRVGAKERESRAAQYLETFEMTKAAPDPIASYSRGMRQKIALIGSLLHHPRLWILDEPMVGLDPRSSFLLKELMRGHADKGGAVFFSTHIMEVAERLCDRLGIIHKGKLIAVGTVAEIRKMLKSEGESTLEEVFLKVTEARLSPEQAASLGR